MEERKTKQGQARARRAGARRRRSHYKQNKAGMICVTVLVLCLMVGFATQIFRLSEKNREYEAQEKQLTAQLEEEQERQEELAAYGEYVATPEYIEELAKTRLGLVYSNEIIFKEEKQAE